MTSTENKGGKNTRELFCLEVKKLVGMNIRKCADSSGHVGALSKLTKSAKHRIFSSYEFKEVDFNEH